MRTTVNIDDEVLELAHEFAVSRSLSLGKAISELARRGLDAQRPARLVDGVYVFELRPTSPRVTSKSVRELAVEGG